MAERLVLPEGWQALTDPTSKSTYYYNQATGSTQWSHPGAPEGAEIVSTLSPSLGDWIPQKDPASGRTYYYNTKSMQTAWKIPSESSSQTSPGGADAPTNLGEEEVEGSKDAKKNKPSRKRDRRQISDWVDFSDLLEDDDGNLDETPPHERVEEAPTKLNLSTDICETEGSLLGAPWVCLHFTRGHCEAGPKCAYLHRVPTERDSNACDPRRDIFGRRRRINRDGDLCGLNKSLCLPNIPAHLQQGGWGKISGVLKKELGTYGPIKAIRPKPNHNIVFIEFSYRCAAEFVKEVMKGQPINLPGIPNFLVHLRWATDPRHLRASLVLERAEKARKEIKDSTLPSWAAQYPDWQQSAYIAQMQGSNGQSRELSYPDTSEQYDGTADAQEGEMDDPTVIPEDIDDAPNDASLQRNSVGAAFDATAEGKSQGSRKSAIKGPETDSNGGDASHNLAKSSNSFISAIQKVRADYNEKQLVQSEDNMSLSLLAGYGSDDD